VAAAQYDLVIRNGLVVDGLGNPAFEGDVAISDGVIVAVGEAPGDAVDTIDAGGRVVAPGFVDIHTHYDVQLFWDPYLEVSPWHGVTTVLSGNCGFGVAPTRPEHRELLLRTLENVEGMPYDCTSEGLGPDWPFVTFREYLDAVERNGIAVNMGFYVGHTPIRVYVMGVDAARREATDEEVAEMKRLVADGIAAGAWGFSTSVHPSHTGYLGLPVPSRLATDEEMMVLVESLGEAGRGVFETNKGPTTFDTLETLMERTGAPVSFSGIATDQGGPGGHLANLARCEELADAGYPLTFQISAMPLSIEFNLSKPYPLARNFPGVFKDTAFLDDLFAPALSSTDPADALALYADEEFRTAVVERTSSPQWQAMFERMSVSDSREHPELIGVSITDIARDRGVAPMLVLLDIAIESELAATFTFLSTNADDTALEQLLHHPQSRMGMTDGGAHIAQICDSRYPTVMLRKWVRELGSMTLERAVQKLTSETADVFGFSDRGRLVPGAAGDVVVFDPDTVDAGPLRRVFDLPAGASRLVSYGIGVEWVVVNGVPLLRDGERLVSAADRAALPGHVLRNSN
jgi:N-acyl-D-aspartate/D-glutamate deacylase